MGIFDIKNGTLKKYIGLETETVIPEGVKKIAEGAFKGSRVSKLQTLHLPGTVTTIDKWAFDRCANLSAVIIPDSVTRISGDAFFECPKAVVV